METSPGESHGQTGELERPTIFWPCGMHVYMHDGYDDDDDDEADVENYRSSSSMLAIIPRLLQQLMKIAR